jgi:hypothetical protein
MKVGRVTRHWNRNCLAVGLSQGFIEPLEATALLFIQQTVADFVAVLEAGDMSEAARDRFNQRVNEHFEGTRDYIVTHYKSNSRGDSEYWRANASNANLSAPLQELFRMWLSGRNIVPEVTQQRLGKGYPVFSWYCILSGMGIFPDAAQMRAPTPKEARYRMAEIDNLLTRSALNFRRQKDVLAAIPPKPRDEALQIYFW